MKQKQVGMEPEVAQTNGLEGLQRKRVNKGEKQAFINSLSSREMESLAALCDTFLPSISEPYSSTKDSLHAFYSMSASMAGTPQLVGGIISGRLKHPSRFSQVSQGKRELILRSWSLSPFYHLRRLFKTLKLLIMLIFFTQVDEENENSTWKALGYCGPDPAFVTQTQRIKTPKDEEDKEQEVLIGPLYKGLVDVTHPREVVAKRLRRSGFPRSTINSIDDKSLSLSSPSLIIQCDAVVVGSGSGGGVVAGVLAKAGYKVVVLEKGNYLARTNLSLLEGPALDNMYLDGGMLATRNVGVNVLAGSTVGGGSTINWSASIRTPDHVIKEWCTNYELELFGSKLYKEAMDVICERMGVQSDIQEEGFNNAVLRKGCNVLGYPVANIPQNSSFDHNCGWCCFGCKDGKKQSTMETWLVDIVESRNGVILSGCNAFKVLHERKKWRNRNSATGVAFEFNNGSRKDIYVVMSKATIIACGAMSTPTLLKGSGLRNPNIGKHLHLHPVAMAWGYFPNSSVSSSNGCIWPGKDKKSYEGPIMTAMSSVVANLEGSGYGAIIQTPSLHPGMFSTLMPWISGLDFKDRMCKFSRTAHIFALARDKGSGIVESLNSFSYEMEPTDEENLQRGLEKILRILAAAGAEEIGTHHCKGKKLNVKEASTQEFEMFVKDESSRKLRDLSGSICSAHQMGSCRMGLNPKQSVVNQRGETWELEGLFLADSSVFPTALGVNPMVTVQSIAYCTAQSVLEFLRMRKMDTI
ncbi:long-chain-alcohol oxidase FAO4A-like isoform X2 [Macadamia integrifolia]|uniref:long-chain-alcohol oxidase FAO4A-like isoform X2 n=1 Tax=Macadamia integrifolia TaxID=60698 RepID=UPI001C4EB837|nr:long-chain-alcohol oxidase FAO4A-like isoform X2 [Macadamia integrifolia]